MSARIDTAAERARLDALAGNTPGPWSQEHRRALDGGFRTQVFPSADPMNTIATLHWHSVPIVQGGERTDRAENAALIASAPDLLTSYRAALDEIDRLTAALAEAEDRGAAQMRERAAVEIVNQDCSAGDLAESIRALPLREPGAAP